MANSQGQGQSKNYHRSFLLASFDRATAAWVTKYSLVAIPLLRPRENVAPDQQQFNRDVFVSVMFTLSFVAVAVCYFMRPTTPGLVLRLVATAGLYRATDMFITLLRSGVFLSFRGDIELDKEPRWRIQRIILAVLINYFELVFWYSTIYLFIALNATCEFDMKITNIVHAFQLSFTTMTTIGYGRYNPIGLFPNAIAFAQAATGIILLVLAIGSMLVMLTKEPAENAPTSSGVVESPSWCSPIVVFLIVAGILYALLGVRTC